MNYLYTIISMNSKSKALAKKVGNMVVKPIKDRKGIKAKLPYTFLKNEGAKNNDSDC